MLMIDDEIMAYRCAESASNIIIVYRLCSKFLIEDCNLSSRQMRDIFLFDGTADNHRQHVQVYLLTYY